METHIIVGVVFFLFGSIFEGVGIIVMMRTRQFIAGSQKVHAEVVSVEENTSTDSDGDETTTYRPTVRFQTLDGQTHEARTYYSASNYDYDVGTTLTVLFKPGEENVRIPGGMNQYFMPGMFIGMGGLFAMIGLGLLVLG